MADKVVEIIKARKLFWVLTIVWLVADLGSKVWAQGAFQPEGWSPGMYTPVHPVLEGVLAWKWAGNLGAAFSIFAGKTWMLASIGMVVIGALIVFIHKTEAPPSHQVGFALIVSGAIGNVWDRVTLGWVRDFIYFDFDLPFHEAVGFIPQRYPVFNVADITILAGAIMLIILSWRDDRRKAAEAKAQPSAV